MRKRLMIGVGILALLMAGCSKQPELDINAEQNLTSNNSGTTQTDDSTQKLQNLI